LWFSQSELAHRHVLIPARDEWFAQSLRRRRHQISAANECQTMRVGATITSGWNNKRSRGSTLPTEPVLTMIRQPNEQDLLYGLDLEHIRSMQKHLASQPGLSTRPLNPVSRPLFAISAQLPATTYDSTLSAAASSSTHPHSIPSSLPRIYLATPDRMFPALMSFVCEGEEPLPGLRLLSSGSTSRQFQIA